MGLTAYAVQCDSILASIESLAKLVFIDAVLYPVLPIFNVIKILKKSLKIKALFLYGFIGLLIIYW